MPNASISTGRPECSLVHLPPSRVPGAFSSVWLSSVVDNGGGLVAQSCLTLTTPGTVVCQAPLSMGLSRQENWSGLQSPSPRNLPDLGIEPRSPAQRAVLCITGGFLTDSATRSSAIVYGT